MDQLAGSLIKSGKFRDAILPFNNEVFSAVQKKKLRPIEAYKLNMQFCEILLNPNNFDEVQELGNQMLQLAIRCDLLPIIACSKEEYEKNLKESYADG